MSSPARRRAQLLAAAAALLGAAVVLVLAPGWGRESAAARAADHFLHRYLEPGGRVVRRDQGGDTVSEGQAYAMLLAAATGDRRRFDAAWGWARAHLQRRDGLLSWLWRDGRVVDPQPAADADVDAAHALVVAARRFDRRRYRVEGLRIGRAVLARETAPVRGGRVLVAGPWARTEPYVVNPSYFAPAAYTALARASGDRRWRELGRSSYRVTARLTRRAPHLPPDWARVWRSGAAAPSAPIGDPGKGARYGFDAVRLPVRMASACHRRDRRLAARAWPFLRSQSGGGPLTEYSLDGRPIGKGTHPAALVAAAAAARAAGSDGASGRLLARADDAERRSSTYYGAAWAALARVMLTTDRLGGCRAR